MGFNIRGGDKSSLALLSSKKGKAYAKSRADEAFALPSFSDAAPAPAPAPAPAVLHPPPQSNDSARKYPLNDFLRKQPLEQEAENVKQTMLQHESMFKEQQLHELHRLYQKQCMLMAESNLGPPPGRAPEPPSSNSSFLCNSETIQLQEEKSFGNVGLSRVCDSNKSYQGLLVQMADIQGRENCVSNGKQSSCQFIGDGELNQKQGRRHLFDLEQSAVNRPIIDLEQPAHEHLELETRKEKQHIPSLVLKSENVCDLRNSPCSGSSKADGKIETPPVAVNNGLQCNKLFGFHINNSKASESRAGAKADLQKNSPEQKVSAMSHMHPRVSWDKKLFGVNIINGNHERKGEDMSKDCLVAKESAIDHLHPISKESVIKLTPSKEEPLSYFKGAVLNSGPFQGLPDLNSDATNFTEGHVSPLQPSLQGHVNNNMGVELEVNSRLGASTSKLPHWLCQAPSTRPLPMHAAVQSCVSQQDHSVPFPRAFDKTLRPSFFLPYMHDKPKELHNFPMAMPMASAMYVQDPSPGLQSNMLSFDQKGLFSSEVANKASQFFHGSNACSHEWSASGINIRESVNGGTLHCSPQVRDSNKICTPLSTSGNLSSRIMGSQGYGIETQYHSTEFLPELSPEGHINFSTFSYWNQQTESFSSLLQQASNPEPFCNKSSDASVWGITSSYQAPPSLGMDDRSRARHCIDAKTSESSSLHTMSAAMWPMYNNMYGGPGVVETVESMKDSGRALQKQSETPFVTVNSPDVLLGDHACDLNSRKMLFDLNVSNEDHMSKGPFDACNAMDMSCTEDRRHMSCTEDRRQKPKPESGISRSSGWGTWGAIEAPFMYQQQKDYRLNNICLGDAFAKCKPASTFSNSDMIHLQNDTSYSMKIAGDRYVEGDMVRDDICADYYSGEDEAEGGLVETKSSDGSGLTSCESRDAVHLEHVKARDDFKTNSGEACHSLESRIPSRNENVTFSSSLQQKVLCSHLPGIPNSLLLHDIQASSSHVNTKTTSSLHFKEFADESEAAIVFPQKDLVEASEAAEILFNLGLDVPASMGDEDSIDDCRKSLWWLADIIPREDHNEDMDVEITDAKEQSLDIDTNKGLDTFEAAVLALKPVDPNLDCVATQPPDRGHGMDIVPMLHRRPSRRSRSGKDFQKEMLRSMSALSRHEVTEDLQIIEGLIKSAAETTTSSSASPEKPSSSPEQIFYQSFGKIKSNMICKDRKLDAMLNVCSWGETTRRKRMGRARSQWLSLPPGVGISLFPDDAMDMSS